MESQSIKPPAGRVLIADDDRSLLELLQDFLTGQGYEVAAVETGAQVLDAMPTFHPDAIVLDLSGADVLAALRRSGLTVPVHPHLRASDRRPRWLLRSSPKAVQFSAAGRGRGGRGGPRADLRCLTIAAVSPPSAPPSTSSDSRRAGGGLRLGGRAPRLLRHRRRRHRCRPDSLAVAVARCVSGSDAFALGRPRAPEPTPELPLRLVDLRAHPP